MRRLLLLMALVAVAISSVFAVAGSAGGSKAHASSSALPSGEIVLTRWVLKNGYRDTSSLFVMAPDGSHVRLLVRNASNAAVSRDGRRIAFDRGDAIWVMRRDGSGQRQLTHPPKVEPTGNPKTGDHDAAWSPDGRIVYFSRMTGYAQASLFSVLADGSGLRRLTRAPIDTGGTDPGTCHQDSAPSPDGRLLAYVAIGWCSRGWEASLAATTRAGRRAKPPFAWPGVRSGEYGSPAWAPEGDVLAYTVEFIDDAAEAWVSSLYLSGTDGSTPQRLVYLPDRNPDGYLMASITGIAWSQDGNWLVLTRNDSYRRKGRVGTWLVRRDGTDLQRITHTAREETDPAWLPPAR